MPRRKKGELIAIEVEILVEALRSTTAGRPRFHGFAMASEMRDGRGSAALIGHGTLYKALARLEDAGLLESTWEDPVEAADAGRPRRRLYRITDEGRLRAAEAISAHPRADQPAWFPGIEPA